MPATDSRRRPEPAPLWNEVIEQKVNRTPWTNAARRRTLITALHAAGWCAVLGLVAYGIVLGLDEMSGTPRKATSRLEDSRPVRTLKVQTDGFLTEDWVRSRINLRPDTRMLSLDLEGLRRTLESEGQVRAATIRRQFPDTLVVHLMERTPVAKANVPGDDGANRTLLVDREGVVYSGFNYDPLRLVSLPFIDGVPLRREANGTYRRIEGMTEVARLLDLAAERAPQLVRSWRVISLANLPRMSVRGEDIGEVIFDSTDFARQLARLDYILDYQRERLGGRLERVDLTLGSQVAVRLEQEPVESATTQAEPAAVRPALRLR